MAKQTGVNKFIGSIGDITFYKMAGKFFARQKKGSNKKKFRLSNLFKSTKKMNDEFGRASHLSALFRYQTWGMIQAVKRGYFPSRLTAVFRKIMLTDPIRPPGKRQLLAGNIKLLEGMEVGSNYQVAQYLSKMPNVGWDDRQQTMGFDFTVCSGIYKKRIPEVASHFHLVPGVLLLEEKGKQQAYFQSHESMELLAVGEEPEVFGNINIQFTIPESASREMLFCAMLGVYFYQEVNGARYLLKGSSAVRVLKAGVWKCIPE